MNTTIDHFYHNSKINVGSVAFTKIFDPIKHHGAHLRDHIQSDHVAMYCWIDFNPMISLKQPRINKAQLLAKLDYMSRA